MSEDDSHDSATVSVSVTVWVEPGQSWHYDLAREAITPQLLVKGDDESRMTRLLVVAYDPDGTMTHATYAVAGFRPQWRPPSWWPRGMRDECEVWLGPDGTADA